MIEWSQSFPCPIPRLTPSFPRFQPIVQPIAPHQLPSYHIEYAIHQPFRVSPQYSSPAAFHPSNTPEPSPASPLPQPITPQPDTIISASYPDASVSHPVSRWSRPCYRFHNSFYWSILSELRLCISDYTSSWRRFSSHFPITETV